MDRNHISDISKTNAHGFVGGETTATMSKSYKWLLLAMLSCAFFFHQADRALFGLLTIPIQKDLGLTDVQIGWINSVLSWTLAGMAFIAGPVGDRFSRKWMIIPDHTPRLDAADWWETGMAFALGYMRGIMR